jgi:hypothetical protein
MTGIAAKLRAAGYRTVMSGKVRVASTPHDRQWGARMDGERRRPNIFRWAFGVVVSPRCHLLVFMFSI